AIKAVVIRPRPEKQWASRKFRTNRIGRRNQAGNIVLRMRGADDPMQAVRGRHVNAMLHKAVNKARIARRIHTGAVIAVVVNRVALGEVDLKHGPETLNNGL